MTITDYYVTTDAMNSVTAILDEDGNVLERRSYDAFGEMTCMSPDGTPVTESPTGVDVGFQGQIRDEDTGLYQMGYRWYNPALGRWLSRDPVGLHGGVNCNVFSINSPVEELDLYGLDSDSSKKRIQSHLEMRGKIKDLLSGRFARTSPQCVNPCELVTVVVNAVSDAASAYGHTGVVVGGRFYDWGPTNGGNDFLSRGGPYWSDRTGIPFESLKYNEKLEGAGEFIVEVQVCVCKLSADRVKKYWEDKYRKSILDTFSGFGVFGTSCSSSARGSLLAMRTFNSLMLSFTTSDFCLKPWMLLENGLAEMINDCGPSKGTKPYARIAYESYR
jgi:RHS repeat-associated protein